MDEPAAEAASETTTPVGRRVLLAMLAAGGGGVLLGSHVQDWVSRTLAPAQASDPTGLLQLLPAAGGFRIYTVVGSLPGRSNDAYRLAVSGLVSRPATLTLAQLRAMPPTTLVRDFQCVTGWRVPNVPWTGVRLSALLDAVGVKPTATAVLFKSFDGVYTESLTMDQARRPDVLVAYDMLGAPVTQQHGGPVRMYVAPMYGYKSCKWLSEIVVADSIEPGYWEQNGYDIDAWIGKSNGRSDQPVV
jgi:DMSO/TMAO reductase YedYZ molybdopterin-dependent catalytic subunit